MKSETVFKDPQKLEDIFHTALSLPREARRAFIADECGADDELRVEIESLIDNFEFDEQFLETPIFETGLGVMHENNQLDLAGSVFGNYEVQERIGVGGMGEVYRALDTKLNRIVALKFLPPGLKSDSLARRQLIKEAQAAAALEHPNICAVYGIEEAEDHRFIVMQYIEGRTLKDESDVERPTPDEFYLLGKQILAAVSFAHSHGILHRDLKPGNIMIDRDRQVKILDFGLAKVISRPATSQTDDDTSRFSSEGLIVGTVSYMSPEQLRGDKLDYRSDIFSVGVLFYHLLSGRNPFSRPSQVETIAAILGDDSRTFEALKKDAPDCPEGYLRFVERCLKKDAAERFQSVAEMALEFESARLGSQRIARFWRPSLAITLLAAVLVIIATIFTAVYFRSITDKTTLAVLPFRSRELPAGWEYLADGLTESTIARFSDFSGIKTKGMYVVSRYKDKDVTPQDAGMELRVDTVLSGFLQNRNDQLILTTQLIRTSDAFVIDSFEQTIREGSLARVPDVVVNRVIDKIRYRLTENDGFKNQRSLTENEDALRLYQRGRFHLKKGQSDDLEKARQFFTDSKDLDQNFAKAWAGLAETYLLMSAPGIKNAISPENAVAYARLTATRARDLDPTASESYYSLGLLSLYYDWNWVEAERNLRLSIETDPEFVSARLALIRLLTWHSRFDEALAEAARIDVIDPLSTSSDLEIAKIHYRRRDFESAQAVINRLKERAAGGTQITYVQSYIYLNTGKYSEALALLDELYKSDKPETKVYAAAPYGFALAKLQRRDEALRVLGELKVLRDKGDFYVPTQESALIYTALGDFESAFETLKKACSEKYRTLPGLVSDPIVGGLQSDYRFGDLKKCVSL